MMTPSELFNNVNEVVEVVEESIEDKQVLEEDISHSVSLIDGAFRNIQEQILNSNRKELSPYKDQVIEVYNLCKDIKENQLPRYKKEVLQSDLRTESRIAELKKELYETLEERIAETEETIKVYFREEIKGVNKLRASVIAVEEYISKNQKTILELREDVFAELRRKDVTSETTQNIINKKLDAIGKEYETLSESLLSDPPSTDNPDPLTPLDQDFVTLDQLKDHYRLFVNRVQQQLYSIGGGGETRLEFLDDVDRDSAKVNGKLLAWNSTVGKFIGTDTVGLSTETQTLDNVLALGGTSSRNMSVGVATFTGLDLDGSASGQLLQNDGSTFVGIASTGFRDYVINHGQGYYAYTTDYYTVGVANTTQEIEEGVWTLLMPQVASDGLYNHQPTSMQDANSGNPWIGAGASIGTGQTEFSLAGLSSGASCIVRSTFRFEPDTDETDLDMRLHFTTNTATQGTGLTNFNIEKQALVMTTGAGVTYASETILSFFVGETLAGLTTEEAGRFCVEVNGTTDGTLEVLGLTIMVDV